MKAVLRHVKTLKALSRLNFIDYLLELDRHLLRHYEGSMKALKARLRLDYIDFLQLDSYLRLYEGHRALTEP